MAIDTLMVYVGVYGNLADAEADYQLVKDLRTGVQKLKDAPPPACSSVAASSRPSRTGWI